MVPWVTSNQLWWDAWDNYYIICLLLVDSIVTWLIPAKKWMASFEYDGRLATSKKHKATALNPNLMYNWAEVGTYAGDENILLKLLTKIGWKHMRRYKLSFQMTSAGSGTKTSSFR